MPLILLTALYLSADMGEPALDISASTYSVTVKNDTLTCGDSYLRQDSCGLWELYIKGSGQERGAVQGALTKDLMKYQEDVFINQIREIIPSDSYLGFLRNFIIIFNRNLGKHIPLEYRNEIVAMSEFCTHDYDAIGSPYERQLNYHAAHDIGHTMQQYMLVGCSSFGVYGDQSENGEMIIGRNFDFYVGDDFAKNKIITFATPDRGYRYASIGWAGMVGVLSGMNACGLTVTINAAKGAIATTAAIPISILTRDILQYASTIDEAYEIARSYQTFVSESILVGSAKDKKVAIIEKTPEQTFLFSPDGQRTICTNHFQSKEFAEDRYNIENIAYSDSQYRYERMSELLDEHPALNYKQAISILRNRFGKGGEDVGIGNEMTLNQSIAHHAVVFKPEERLMWVSTSAWQSGAFVCYDLKSFFEGKSHPRQLHEFAISADSSFFSTDYPRLIQYRAEIRVIKDAMTNQKELGGAFIDKFLEINPNHYYTYRILGDYYMESNQNNKAMKMYTKAVHCSIPYKSEQIEINKLIQELNK